MQNLRYHLTGGGSIGFHIGKGGVLDSLRSLSVMVQHHDGFAETKQIRALCNGRLIHVHNDQHGIAARGLYGLLAVHYHIIIIFRIVLKQVHQRLDGGCHIV